MDKWRHSCVHWGVVWESCASLAVTSSHEIDQAGGHMAPPTTPLIHKKPQRKTHGCALTVLWARWIGSSWNHWGNQHTTCPKPGFWMTFGQIRLLPSGFHTFQKARTWQRSFLLNGEALNALYVLEFRLCQNRTYQIEISLCEWSPIFYTEHKHHTHIYN